MDSLHLIVLGHRRYELVELLSGVRAAREAFLEHERSAALEVLFPGMLRCSQRHVTSLGVDILHCGTAKRSL
jgi:hypothetical protein